MSRLIFCLSLPAMLGFFSGCASLGGPSPAFGNAPPPAEAASENGLFRFWEGFIREEPPEPEEEYAFQAWGHRLTAREYQIGLTGFLNGRERTAELEDAWRSRLSEQFLTLRWLEATGRHADEEFRLRARFVLREALTSMVLNGTAAAVQVSSDEVRAFYDANPERFEQPAMVEVRMILVPTVEEAEEVLAALAEGETFASLASARSKHESANQFGQLPPFARGTYNQAFEEKAFEMQPGTTDMVATGAGVFVIRKIANIPRVTVPFEQVRASIRAELERERRAAFRAEQLATMTRDLGPEDKAGADL